MSVAAWRWTRRTLVTAFVIVLTVMWLVAPTTNVALALATAVLTVLYMAGSVVACFVYAAWLVDQKARLIVVGIVGSRMKRSRPKLVSYRREGLIQHYGWEMPAGMTLTQLERWREVFEQALNRKVDWRYEAGKYHMRVVEAEVPVYTSFGEVYGSWAAPAGELVFAVGMGLFGPVWADLASLPHLLIGGLTGAGKSVYLRQMVTWLVLRNGPERLRLGLIDLKGGMELGVFQRLPHLLCPVLKEWQDCGRLLEELNGELDRRQAEFEAAGVVGLAEWNRRYPEAGLPYLVLVIDETAELTAVETPDRAERASRQAQLALLIRLCRLGRAAGICVACATQRPDSDAVPGQLKANLPATMAFRVRDPVNSRVLLGDGHPEAASLPAVPGRGIWQTDGQVEVQTPWLSRQEAAALLEQAYPGSAPGGTNDVTRCPPSAGVSPAGGRR